jgi:hypothetical protein
MTRTGGKGRRCLIQAKSRQAKIDIKLRAGRRVRERVA